MKKNARKKVNAQNNPLSFFKDLLGSEEVKEIADEYKPPTADDIADALLSKLEQKQKLANSDIDYDYLANLVVSKMGGNNGEE